MGQKDIFNLRIFNFSFKTNPNYSEKNHKCQKNKREREEREIKKHTYTEGKRIKADDS